MAQMCKDHWKKLKEALSDRGLNKAFSVGEGLREKMQDNAAGIITDKEAFEPLWNANMAIFGNALRLLGPDLLLLPNDGDKEPCPICSTIAACPCGGDPSCSTRLHVENWVVRAADDQFTYAKELGLIIVS